MIVPPVQILGAGDVSCRSRRADAASFPGIAAVAAAHAWVYRQASAAGRACSPDPVRYY